MNLPTSEDHARAQLRRGVYLLLIVVSTGAMTARIMTVNEIDKLARESFRTKEALKKKGQEQQKLEEKGITGEELERELTKFEDKVRKRYKEQRPFLSGNDRSRWCMVRALVEHGTYEIDEITVERGWNTIDMVKHPNRDGEDRLYSSKPTLLPTIVAGEYWVIHRLTGYTLGEKPFVIGRFMLVTINVIPLMIALLLLAKIVERYGTSDWGRMFVMAAASFGTLLVPFSLAFNNHLIAAVCATIMIHAVLRIWYDDQRGLHWFVLAGLFGALMAAIELPALSVLAMVAAGLLWKQTRPALLGFVPAALLVVVAALATQYIAHGVFSPAYAHRKAGEHRGDLKVDIREILDRNAKQRADLQKAINRKRGEMDDEMIAQLKRLKEGTEIREALAEIDVELAGSALVAEKLVRRKTRSDLFEGWVIGDGAGRYSIFIEGDKLSVYEWNDWYEYTFNKGTKRSYWSEENKNRAAIDRGEKSKAVYALHCLVGHHGIFSLTPVWLLSVVGVVLLARGRLSMWELALLIAVTTLVVFAFYMFRPAEDRNYGGTSSGLRWMIWFTPLWLIAMIPAADVASRWRPSRGICYLLLTLSVLSAHYPSWKPWQHPWLWNLMQYVEWI
ncbi:MAG: hypothetical protein IID44_21825 [Planctomycetes bacterium]|nr:hypothetical protein [Planctomycetota bacterium]